MFLDARSVPQQSEEILKNVYTDSWDFPHQPFEVFETSKG
jgi:hypothetical protein